MSDIDVSFFCVQPIHIHSDIHTKILLKKMPFKEFERYCLKSSDIDPNSWHQKYNNLYDTYRELKEINLEKIPAKKLKEDLGKDFNFTINNKKESLSLAKFLDNNTTYTLFFDPRFSYFILVYEICFRFPRHKLSEFLDYNNRESYNNRDLYNTIRNLIVKENNSSTLSSWGQNINSSVISKVSDIISSTYKLKLSPHDISIQHNSCNISCFIFDNKENDQELITEFNDLNMYAERLTTNETIRSLYDGTVNFSFNGRFHTIYLKNKQDQCRFQPLQFHIQFMWFLIERYNKLMNQMNLELMQNDSMANLKKYSDIIHIIINKIEFLSLHDSNFKHSIEIDYQKIYIKNEQKWSLMESLASSKQYVVFFKDYLDRLFHQNNESFQKRQNYILLFISVLQLVALLSVWGDYLSLLNKNNLTIDDRLLSLFSTQQNLITFNLYIPIYIFIVILSILLYLFFKKRR